MDMRGHGIVTSLKDPGRKVVASANTYWKKRGNKGMKYSTYLLVGKILRYGFMGLLVLAMYSMVLLSL